MKRILIMTIAVVTIMGISGRAQDQDRTEDVKSERDTRDSRDRFQFGVKAGLIYSNVYDTKGEAFEADPKFGVTAGAFFTIPIGEKIGVQPEILFSQKGFKATGVILGAPYDFKRTTSYIDVPLFVTLKPAEFLTLLAGPQYSYLIKQRDVFANAITTIEQEQEFENDDIRTNTLGFATGIDINLEHAVLSGRVAWDIQRNNRNGSSTTPRYKNVWFQIALGYRL